MGVIPYVFDSATKTMMQILSTNETKIVIVGTIKVTGNFFLLTITGIINKTINITIGKGTKCFDAGMQAVLSAFSSKSS